MKDLELGDLVLAEPEFFEGCKRFQILDFLGGASMTNTCICRGYEHCGLLVSCLQQAPGFGACPSLLSPRSL